MNTWISTKEKFWKNKRGSEFFCHTCKRQVFRTFPVDNPQRGTVDLIVPISEGGTHDISNWCASCLYCNRRLKKMGLERDDYFGLEEMMLREAWLEIERLRTFEKTRI